MRVLWLTMGSPWPPITGARVRDYELIRRVGERHAISLLVLHDPATLPGRPEELSDVCESVEHRELRPRAWWEHLQRYPRLGQPAVTYPFFEEEVADRIAEIVAARDIDILQIEHSLLAGYRAATPAGSRLRTVLSLHNVASRQYRSMARVSAGFERTTLLAKWLLLRRGEARLASRFDAVVVVSDEERAALGRLRAPTEVAVVPNGVDTERLQPLDEAERGNDLLFVGTFTYPPNRDAVLWFARQVLPVIRESVHDATFTIVGHEPPAEIRALAAGVGIEVTGPVPDVTPYYQRARVCVAPLRAGGGTRLKILEAMALGRPVASTTFGCEGLDVEAGLHLVVEDRAEDLARGVVRLLRNGDLRTRMAADARRRVESRYDWARASARLLELYDRIAG